MRDNAVSTCTRRAARWIAAATLALGSASALAGAGGFEELTDDAAPLFTVCNPSGAAGVPTCRVASLPGQPNFALVAARSQPLVINEVTVGTLQERIWRRPLTNLFILGVRVQLNQEVWDETGRAFSFNDLLRQVRSDREVSVAYLQANPGARALRRAGRSAGGLNEIAQGERNNAWVDFRVDADASKGSPWSPWLLTRTRAPEGLSLQDFALRLLNSRNVDVDQNSLYARGYQPVCSDEEVCGPPDEDDEEEAAAADPTATAD